MHLLLAEIPLKKGNSMWNFSPVETRATTKPGRSTGPIHFGVTVNASASLPQSTLGKSPISPKSRTAPTKAELLSTSDETPKKIRRLLALIRVLLASFYDVAKALPECRLLAKDGSLYIKVTWTDVDLSFDADHDLTVSFSTGEKEGTHETHS